MPLLIKITPTVNNEDLHAYHTISTNFSMPGILLMYNLSITPDDVVCVVEYCVTVVVWS